ncbi:hypothetical protein WA556_002694 [Blastocystis sp. ATCC 50177/Nand II]
MNSEEVKTISSVSRDIILKQVISLPEGENFILILDDVTMALVNSVCGQFALFDRGCILMEHIRSKRDCVSNVTAIYFVEPTELNIGMILEDFKEIKSFIDAESCIDRIIYCGMDDQSGESCLYDRVALRFKGDLADDLAKRILANKVLNNRLLDTRLIHMDYHVEEPNLAVTGIPTALKEIWGRNRNHGVLERIAHSMVDICVNLGIKPRVHYQSEYPCDAIADLFEDYMLQYIANYQPVLREKGQLLLVARTFDPLVPLLHPINYQPMAMDLLAIGEGGEFEYRSEGASEPRKVLLNDHDTIWANYKYEHILNTRSLLSAAAKRFLESTQESKSTIQDISNLIKTLPENKRRKDLFALHLAVSGMCVEQFKNRALNKCIPLEQVMVTGFDEAASSPSQEKIVKELEELLRQDLSQQDKIRLVLIYAIAQELSATTRQTLLAASQLGAEYVSILDNLSMLGVRVESKMEQRMDRSDYQKAAKQLKDSLMTNRYTSQLRFALNDLFTNALSPARFQVYDSGTNAFQGVIGVDVSRSVRGNMRSARALKKSKAADAESAAVEWYGKPAKKPVVITGEPVICYVVGGTCFAEIESLNELAEVCGRNVTIATTNIFKQTEYVDSLRDLDLSVMLLCVCLEMCV